MNVKLKNLFHHFLDMLFFGCITFGPAHSGVENNIKSSSYQAEIERTIVQQVKNIGITDNVAVHQCVHYTVEPLLTDTPQLRTPII